MVIQTSDGFTSAVPAKWTQGLSQSQTAAHFSHGSSDGASSHSIHSTQGVDNLAKNCDVSWNAGNLARQGMDVATGRQKESLIGKYLAGAAHLKIIQEACEIHRVQHVKARRLVVQRNYYGDHAFIIGGREHGRRATILEDHNDRSPWSTSGEKGYLSWCIAHIHFGKRLCKDITNVKVGSAHLHHGYARNKPEGCLYLMKSMWKKCLEHETMIVTGDFNACAYKPPASGRQHPDDDYVTQALTRILEDLSMTASVA